MKKSSPVVLHQLSNFASGLGNSIVMITIPWLILEETGSPAFAGLVAAISAIPGLIISPIGGWLVDHVGRRAVSVGADLLSSLAVLAFPIVAFTYGLSSLSILLIAVIGAVFDPAGYTARKTLLADVAKASEIELDRLNGIHDGFMGISWILGPAVGAGLISTVGAINSFWVSAGLFVLAALSIVFLRVGNLGKDARELAEQNGEVTDRSFRIGFQVLWGDKLLRTITISVLILAAVYLPTETVVLPTYFEELGNPAGLGIVISALAAGSAIGSFGYGWISKRISRKNLVRMTLIGTAANPGKYVYVKGSDGYTYAFMHLDEIAKLKRGQKLKVPLATPTTKAKVGHDENVSWQTVEDQYPGILAFGQKVFELVSHWCESHGNGRLLDFKIEVAYDRDSKEFILCDEVSPDTCRLCLEMDSEALMRGKSVEFYDKEFGRQYLASLGIRALDPENADDIARVNLWTPEKDFIDEMHRRLEVGCRILTGGFSSQEFLRDAIGV